MKNFGLADSPFFPKQSAMPKPSNQELSAESGSDPYDTMASTRAELPDDPSHDREPDTMISGHLDATVETVRLAVKEYRKEAATHRFTKSEKEAISAIIYAFKRLNIKTSENEITRIAVNYIVQDYVAMGEQSFLAKVLQALNA